VFEPVPLYQVLGKKGLDHWTECRGPEDWWITFFPAPGNTEGPPPAAVAGEGQPGIGAEARREEVTVDARGLEPPQPMQRILEALAGLPDGATLRARTDRRPMLLYPNLDERGYRYETREADDDGYETRIWR
jgi:TusA-related sulfurtransferase